MERSTADVNVNQVSCVVHRLVAAAGRGRDTVSGACLWHSGAWREREREKEMREYYLSRKQTRINLNKT